MDTSKKVLLGLSAGELKEVARSLGMPAFAGRQIAQWLYDKHVQHIDEMTNLSLRHRELLAAHYCIGAMAPADCQRSQDGTVKYLFPVRCSDDAAPTRMVETVFIPDDDRATLCVSCQVGCKMNCLFCQTGKQGWEGNLTAADILNQIYSLPERERITNVVFMGQGEPMDNLRCRRLCLEPQAHHREQCGTARQAAPLPRREPVPRGHIHALAAARAATGTHAGRARHDHCRHRGPAAPLRLHPPAPLLL